LEGMMLTVPTRLLTHTGTLGVWYRMQDSTAKRVWSFGV